MAKKIMKNKIFTLCQCAKKFLPVLLLALPSYAVAATPGIAAGFFHSLALKADGSVWAWGYNGSGQLGDGSKIERVAPVEVLPPGSGVIQIAAGKIYSLALKADGSVWAWGNNAWGQMGDGTKINRLSPISVLPPGSNVIKIAAGKDFAFALKKDGSVWGWGTNDSHQLGPDKTDNLGEPEYFIRSPIEVMAAGSGVIEIAPGNRFALALKRDGSVWAWGNNERGQLGTGTQGERKWPPVQTLQLSRGVIAISAGTRFSVALKKDGSLWTWGNNGFGQLGDGSMNDRSSPQRILPAGSGVIALATGVSHTLALKKNGSVWAWGTNNAGQLGNGTAWTRESVKLHDLAGVPKQLSPLQVVLPGSGVIALAASNGQSLALKADGGILEWGNANPRDPWLGMSSPGKLVPTLLPDFP